MSKDVPLLYNQSYHLRRKNNEKRCRYLKKLYYLKEITKYYSFAHDVYESLSQHFCEIEQILHTFFFFYLKKKTNMNFKHTNKGSENLPQNRVNVGTLDGLSS